MRLNLYGHAIPEQNREALDVIGELIMPATLEIPAQLDDDEDELGAMLEVKKR